MCAKTARRRLAEQFPGEIDTEIVGGQYYDAAIQAGERVNLEREPENEHDNQAIRVENGRFEPVGHLPRAMAAWLAKLMDSGKLRLDGYVPAAVAAALFDPWFAIFIAAAPVVGHIYSIFLKGKGGKGIATGAAVVLALVPLVFAIILAVWIVLVITTRYVSVASLTASFLVPVLAFALGEPAPYKIAGVLVAVIVWWAHRGNIRRLLAGEEHRVKLPWGNGGRAPSGGQEGA